MSWEFIDEHLKQMRDSLIAERTEDVAWAQREADKAAAEGDDRWRQLWQDKADRMQAYRFHWEREQDAA